MHRCLHISEIVVSVAECVRENDADLLRLALVCRAFYEPAMDVLWARTPYALEKLLLCLPPDAVYTTQLALRIDKKPISYNPIICCGLKRSPDTSEWTRFIHHARRIKAAELSLFHCGAFADRKPMTLSALDILHVHFDGRRIFPNIQALKVEDGFEAHLDLFIHEDLSSFCASNCTNMSLASMLSALERCASHLEHLSILPPYGMDSSLAISSQALFLPLCRNLTSLSTWVPVTSQTLAFLAISLRLNSLKLGNMDLSALSVGSQPVLSGQTLLFANLEEMELSAPAQYAADILRAMSLPIIQHVSIAFNTGYLPDHQLTPTSEPALDDVMTAIASFPTLRSVSLSAFDPFIALNYISGASLFPFTRLSRLTKLNIDRLHVDLRPTDIAQLAAAWPHVQELGLAYERLYTNFPELDFHPSICIEDIYPFAERCPALHTLTIAVAGDVEPAAPREGPRVVHRGLRKLSLASSRLNPGEERARVATFVREVFPEACAGFRMLENGAEGEIRELLV